MKLKNILAGVSACAVTIGAMAFSASALITNYDKDNKDKNGFTYDCKELDLNSVYGIQADITFTGALVDDTNGGLAFNADDKKGTGWNQFTWKLDASGKKVDAGTDSKVKIEDKGNNSYTISVIADKAYFTNGKDWDWANVYVGSWGGTDFTVNKLSALDKDGKALGAREGEAAPAATETTASSAAAETSATTAAETTGSSAASTSASAGTTKSTTAANAGAATTAAAGTKKADATKAGDSGIGMAVAGLTVGAAALYFARKKH